MVESGNQEQHLQIQVYFSEYKVYKTLETCAVKSHIKSHNISEIHKYLLHQHIGTEYCNFGKKLNVTSNIHKNKILKLFPTRLLLLFKKLSQKKQSLILNQSAVHISLDRLRVKTT